MRAIYSIILVTAALLQLCSGRTPERFLLQSNAEANSQAVAVGGDGQSASSSASSEATASSSTPPTIVNQCVTFENTNFSGELIRHTFAADIGSCCNTCQQQQGCNVFVYCPNQGGCDNGYGSIFPYQLCSLKYQTLEAGVDPTAYGRGPNVPWRSGIVETTALGEFFSSKV